MIRLEHSQEQRDSVYRDGAHTTGRDGTMTFLSLPGAIAVAPVRTTTIVLVPFVSRYAIFMLPVGEDERKAEPEVV